MNRQTHVINPYTFVMLPEARSKGDPSEGKLTGKITCTLTTRTPLFIPNITNERAFPVANADKDHKSFDFFSYAALPAKELTNTYQTPVIPGSSLRGMLHGVYEALTGSCLSAVNDELVLHKRRSTAGKPYILDRSDGKFYLWDAKKYMACYKPCRNDDSMKYLDDKPVGSFFKESLFCDGQPVWFVPGKAYEKRGSSIGTTVEKIYTTPQPPEANMAWGYILLGNEIGNKHHFSILKKTGPLAEEFTSNSKTALDMLWRLLDGYPGFDEYTRRFKSLETADGELPVFGQKVNGLFYLSPACITKEVFRNQLHDLLGQFSPCKQADGCCPACRLFGMVGTNNEEALAGRIRVTDAKLTREPAAGELPGLFEPVKTLKELSGPKITSTEFYLRRPNARSVGALAHGDPPMPTTAAAENGAATWHYDFAVTKRGNRTEVLPGYRPRISGRKFYWQHDSFSWARAATNEATKRNATVRALKPKLSFQFTVYFERLHQKELDELLATLTLGGAGHCHSLGHGKPLGLGSVSIAVDSAARRELTVADGTIRRTWEPCDTTVKPLREVFCEAKYGAELAYIAKQMETVTALHDFEGMIDYPRPLGGQEIYRWFALNRGAMRPEIRYVLPELPVSAERLKERVALPRDPTAPPVRLNP